jgi:excisionase family DNA binding protein
MQPSQNQPRALLTALEVQQLLHIDRSTVYRMAEDGRLPAIRVGRSWRFPADRIEAMLGTGAVAGAGAVAGSERPEAQPGAALPGLDDAPIGGPPAGGPALVVPASAAADSTGPAGAVTAAPAVPVVPDQRSARTTAVPVNAAAAAAVVEIAADLLGVMMVVTDMHGRPMTEVAHPSPWFVRNAGDPAVLDRCVAEWHDLADHPDLTPRFQQGALGFQCARAFIRQGSTLVGMVLAGGVSPSASPDVDPDLYHLDDAARQRVLTALPRIAAAISTTSPHPGTTTQAPPRAAATRPVPLGAATKEY